MTYRECYEQGCRTLQAAGIEEAALDARLLLEAVCGTDRNDLLVHGEQPVAPEAEEKYLNWIRQRAEHIPLQQLTGEQGFMGLTFSVNEHVLIPRQDTEILVEEVLKELHDGMRVLDMCTGSGCILLSLLHYSNDCEGLGVDLSAEALKVAGRNVLKVLTPEKAEHAHFLQSASGRKHPPANAAIINISALQKKYNDFPKLPIWMSVEIMSLGILSKFYLFSEKRYKEEVAQKMCLNHYKYLEKLLHSITIIRNKCAHHSRLLCISLNKLKFPKQNKEKLKYYSNWINNIVE